jgi:hypothetical protein
MIASLKLYYPFIVAWSSVGGVIFAQELPPMMEWAKLPLEVICVGALSYIAIKVWPAQLRAQIEAQQQQQANHSQQLDKVLSTHRQAHSDLASALTDKMECQTKVLESAIREVKSVKP